MSLRKLNIFVQLRMTHHILRKINESNFTGDLMRENC